MWCFGFFYLPWIKLGGKGFSPEFPEWEAALGGT